MTLAMDGTMARISAWQPAPGYIVVSLPKAMDVATASAEAATRNACGGSFGQVTGRSPEHLVGEEFRASVGASDETKRIRIRLVEIRQKIDSLVESLTPVSKKFVDERLAILKDEKTRL